MDTNKPFLYIYCDDFREFQKIEKESQEYNCLYIADEHFLNLRTPGKILILENEGIRWDHIGIMASIEYHLELPEWGRFDGVLNESVHQNNSNGDDEPFSWTD